MHHPVQLAIFLLASTTLGAIALALRPHAERPLGYVLRAAAAFGAALFALKLLPLFLPEEGFLRSDGLYPLWARWQSSETPGWIAPALLCGIPCVAALVGRVSLRPLAFALAPALWIGLALTHGGADGVTEPFRRDADYQADVARFRSLEEIWRTYEERQPTLSLHGRTHPPGAVTVLWVLHRLTGGDLLAACLAVVLLSAAGLLPVYALARAFMDRAGAEAATLLWITTPAVALYGATCMDMVFAVPLVASAAAFAWGVRGPSGALASAAGWGVLSGTALAVGSLFTFSSAVLAVTLVLTAALVTRRQPRERVRLTVLLGTTGVTCLALLLALRPLGFDWFACLETARRVDVAQNPAGLSPSYWVLTRLMGVLDVLLLAGPAAAMLWLGGLRRRAFARSETPQEDSVVPRLVGVALSRAAAVAVLAFLLLGVYKIGETGRILLFLLPLVPLLAVARLQRAWPTLHTWQRGVAVLVALNLVQVAAFELLLDTRW